jgi:hypothetical protein
VLAGEEEEGNSAYIYTSDTANVSAPYNKTYSLGPRSRFYFKAFSEEGLNEAITVKVLIGGTERYNSTSTLQDLTLEFIYTVR